MTVPPWAAEPARGLPQQQLELAREAQVRVRRVRVEPIQVV